MPLLPELISYWGLKHFARIGLYAAYRWMHVFIPSRLCSISATPHHECVSVCRSIVLWVHFQQLWSTEFTSRNGLEAYPNSTTEAEIMATIPPTLHYVDMWWKHVKTIFHEFITVTCVLLTLLVYSLSLAFSFLIHSLSPPLVQLHISPQSQLESIIQLRNLPSTSTTFSLVFHMFHEENSIIYAPWPPTITNAGCPFSNSSSLWLSFPLSNASSYYCNGYINQILSNWSGLLWIKRRTWFMCDYVTEGCVALQKLNINILELLVQSQYVVNKHNGVAPSPGHGTIFKCD